MYLPNTLGTIAKLRIVLYLSVVLKEAKFMEVSKVALAL